MRVACLTTRDGSPMSGATVLTACTAQFFAVSLIALAAARSNRGDDSAARTASAAVASTLQTTSTGIAVSDGRRVGLLPPRAPDLIRQARRARPRARARPIVVLDERPRTDHARPRANADAFRGFHAAARVQAALAFIATQVS